MNPVFLHHFFYFLYDTYFLRLYSPDYKFLLEYTPDNTKITDDSLHTSGKELDKIYIGTYFFNGIIINTRKGLKNERSQIYNTSNKYFGNEFMTIKNITNNSLLFENTKQYFFNNKLIKEKEEQDYKNFKNFLQLFCISNISYSFKCFLLIDCDL